MTSVKLSLPIHVPQQVIQSAGAAVEIVVKEASISVECQRRGSVASYPLDHLDIGSRADGQGYGSVPQIVEGGGREVGLTGRGPFNRGL